jgi:hypothetical protein
MERTWGPAYAKPALYSELHSQPCLNHCYVCALVELRAFTISYIQHKTLCTFLNWNPAPVKQLFLIPLSPHIPGKHHSTFWLWIWSGYLILVEVYSIHPFVTGCFCLAWCRQGSSMLQHVCLLFGVTYFRVIHNSDMVNGPGEWLWGANP